MNSDGNCVQYGLENFLPKLPQSETPDTICAHIEFLKAECKKKNWNRDKVNTVMEITFPHRRHYIVMQEPSITEVLSEYPALIDKQQASILLNIGGAIGNHA